MVDEDSNVLGRGTDFLQYFYTGNLLRAYYATLTFVLSFSVIALFNSLLPVKGRTHQARLIMPEYTSISFLTVINSTSSVLGRSSLVSSLNIDGTLYP